MLRILVASLAAYLCGSIPTGVLLTRRLGIDIRNTGSGNVGATNVARSAGKTVGLLTLLGDALKGLIPVVVVRMLGLGEVAVACTAVAALLGHIFSPFLQFSGGKGVATGLGIFLGMAPQAILIALVAFIVIVAASRIVSLASIAATAILPPLLMWLAYPTSYIWAGIIMSALVIIRHKDNILRLLRGEEAKFSFAKTPPPAA
jgi:acyl phosphate:glycerol-3-phosphate acyltransferase